MTTQPEQQTTAPEVVAWGITYPPPHDDWNTASLYHLNEADQAKDEVGGESGTQHPLVTQPDALAYAEAQVREAEARIVAWLREQADDGSSYRAASALGKAATVIERGEHRA